MRTWLATAAFITRRMGIQLSAVAALLTVGAATALAQPAGEAAGGEASLKLPDLSQVSFFNGAIDGHKLLLIGILFCWSRKANSSCCCGCLLQSLLQPTLAGCRRSRESRWG